MSGGLPRETYRRIKSMSRQEMSEYLRRFYLIGFEDGLREGEREYDDAIIMDEDEARDRLGDEAFQRLLEQMG